MIRVPRSRHPATTAAASSDAGCHGSRSQLSSRPIMAPSPRTSPTCGQRSDIVWSLVRMRSPMCVARPLRSSRSMTRSVARAAAHETGFPPNVPPMVPGRAAFITSDFPITAPSGSPPPSALAHVEMSGTMPACSYAAHVPVRQRPLCTSSAINRMPCSSHSARKPRRYS